LNLAIFPILLVTFLSSLLLTNETFASQELSGNDYFVVVKQTDESLANNTTLHDDVELKVTLDAHKVYSWEARIFTTADSSTPDIRWAMDVPAGATIRYNDFGWDSDQAFFTGDGRVGDEHLGGIGAGETTFELHGYVIMGGTAGDLQFQWAQAESHVDNVTVNKGSSLKVYENNIYKIIKTEDESISSSTTLQDDDELVIELKANNTVPISPNEIILPNDMLESPLIPDWIRNNAKWWVQGSIGDNDFMSGIQFLIKEGIMNIPETAKTFTADGSQEIPLWIKNNADWWSQGLISDDDFVKGIQYLVEQGIIRV